MNRLRNQAGLLVVLASAVIIFSLLPLGTAFEIGDDEGFEVIKAFMCSKGYRLYTEIWNDQPPVSTMILKTAFQWFGTSILTARVVAAGFGLLLLGVFHELVRMRSGKWPALIGSFLLLAAPSVLLLSVSVMLEAEAFATALLAAWLLFRWIEMKKAPLGTEDARATETGRKDSTDPSPQPSPLWKGRGRILLLIASGAVMGAALQTKLTCILAAPAIVVELWLASTYRLRPTKLAVTNLLVWGLSLAAVFALIGFTWGKGALASSWKSHTGTQSVPGMDRPEEHKFDVRLIGQHWECIGAAMVGIVLVRRRRHPLVEPGYLETKAVPPHPGPLPKEREKPRRAVRDRRAQGYGDQITTALSPTWRWREIAFPLTLLLTTVAIHSVHRPWWNYYYIHFAIPIAWLAGIAVNEGIQTILRLFSAEPTALKPKTLNLKALNRSKASTLNSRTLNWSRPSTLIPLLLLCLAVAFVIARSERRLESGVRSIRSRPAADANPIVKAMKAHASGAKWIYSENGIYAFHARLLVPPEIAIVMPKRFWSGQATTSTIVATGRKYGIGMVVLPMTSLNGEWQRFLGESYLPLAKDEKSLLYYARTPAFPRESL